ncbi:MAG TPA: DUF488 family protein [Acidimicrobiales bacterium]|nr:DUF488 family protein [Acidimicrobiales bacterium]
MGRIDIARVYDQAGEDPSGRFLVDRLWPRGLAKSGAPFEYWAKDVSPSNALRKRYGHAGSRFEEFADRYRGELASPAGLAALEDLRGRIGDRDVTLLTATKELASSHLTVLAEVLAHP